MLTCSDVYAMLLQSKDTMSDEDVVFRVHLLQQSMHCGHRLERIADDLKAKVGDQTVARIERLWSDTLDVRKVKCYFLSHRFLHNRMIRREMSLWDKMTILPGFLWRKINSC